MTHEMKLQPVYFNKIRSGEKIYEIRLNDEKRKTIKVGNYIVFKKEPQLVDQITCKVSDLIIFDSFKTMIETLPPALVGFENMSNTEIIDIYHQFYTEADEKHYGVLAIKVEI